MNVAHLLSERAASCGDQPAIIDGSRILTFKELEESSANAAGRLRAAGLHSGDVVLVLIPITAELYIALNAVFRLGLVAMFLDPSAGREHIESCCKMQPPQAFIGSPKAHCLRFLSPALRKIPLKFSIGKSLLGARQLVGGSTSPESEKITPCNEDTPALIRFTTGSTGEPKAAVRTHGFLLEQQRVIKRSLKLVAGEIDLATLPIFVLANLASGVTSVIPNADLRAPGLIKPEPVVQQIQRHRPQRVSTSPAFLERLADHCIATSQQLDCFQKIFTGGAPVFPHLLDKFQKMSPQAEVVAVYGSTEAEPIAKINRSEISEADREAMWSGRGLLAGKPDEAIHLRILRESSGESGVSISESDFNEMSLPEKKTGQIVVSGPHVQPGYLRGIGDAETKLRVGEKIWHKTGDAGYLDPQGRLWLLGRCNAIIKDEHGTLYPFQVECAVHRDPGIHHAALIAHQGKRLLAVELQTGTRMQNLDRSLDWAGIHRVRILPRIPMDQRHNAKINYAALMKIL